jgi:phosphoribosylformimino-5-aminoimidazole carboxamide ribotide isomerase
MKFRPCIDLHNGQVKQIVGSTLTEAASSAESTSADLATNFSTTQPAADFTRMYQRDNLTGGHVIMLGPGNKEAATSALAAWPNGLQVGGGVTDETAAYWLEQGASHVIVTSHVFKDGQIAYDKLQTLVTKIGKERLVLDLSCRRQPSDPSYCDEFLVHGVDVEGKQCGILEDLVVLLGKYSPVPVTYAGGVRSLADLDHVQELGQGKVDCTVGSALDIFGGGLEYKKVVAWHKEQNPAVEESK